MSETGTRIYDDTKVPAFPQHEHRQSPHYEFPFDRGMSLRDYFAAAALSNATIVQSAFGIERDPNPPDEVAGYCYDLADAMLEVRKKHL